MIMVVLIITCATTAILLLPKPQVAILQNGDRLTLERVTFGTNHVFSDHPRSLDQLANAVPALRRLFQLSPRISRASSEISISLWFSEFNTQSNLYVEPRWQAAQVVDEHGCIILSYDRGYNRGEGPKKIRPVLLNAWPRHQEHFTVNIFDQFNEGDTPISTFSVHNPHRINPASALQATALPTEAVAGAVTVRLARIAVRDRAPRPPSFEPEFEFIEHGKRSRDWSADEITWSDSAGNSTGFSGAVALCLHEPVWNLKARVLKKPGAQFAPENVWSMPALKLPGPGQLSPLSFSTTVQGAKLSILGIAGPGKVVYSNGVPVEAKVGANSGRGSIAVRGSRIELECERHHLALDCVGLGGDQRLDLRCRQLPGDKAGPDIRMTMSAGTCQFYPIEVNPGTQAILVEAIVQSGHRVTFAVKPQRE
jgi:hypothetical protein